MQDLITAWQLTVAYARLIFSARIVSDVYLNYRGEMWSYPIGNGCICQWDQATFEACLTAVCY